MPERSGTVLPMRLPYKRKKLYHSGKDEIVTTILFPSYVFVETENVDGFAASAMVYLLAVAASFEKVAFGFVGFALGITVIISLMYNIVLWEAKNWYLRLWMLFKDKETLIIS